MRSCWISPALLPGILLGGGACFTVSPQFQSRFLLSGFIPLGIRRLVGNRHKECADSDYRRAGEDSQNYDRSLCSL